MEHTAGTKESQASSPVRHAIFLDTSGWTAAAVRGQMRHEEARSAYTAAVRQGYRIVVTPLVLGESHALFFKLFGRAKATAAIEGVLRDPTHVLVPVDETLIKAAVERWMVPYRDQPFSLCDAVSFEVMKREEITRALCLDRHFVAAGFEIIG